MKKWFTMRKWLVLLLVLAASCMLFAACDEGESSADGHQHEYSSEWDYDETYHWHNAVCEHTDVVKDHQEHTYANGKCTECGADAPKTEAWVSVDMGGCCAQ